MAYRVSAIAGVLIGAMFIDPSSCAIADQRLSWITGYWYSPPVWGGMPVQDIDYSALTHIIHYSLIPRSDGSLDAESLTDITSYAPDLIRSAHRRGVKVLISIAQSARRADFLGATKASTLPTLISRIMDVVQKYGYDGVDIDWETSVNTHQFANLASGLRRRLDSLTPRGVLTGAFWEAGPYVVGTENNFDQLNIMAYDMCSPKDGFYWHNAALHDAGDGKRRSVDKRMGEFASVVPSNKLGLGIPFYGYVWSAGAEETTHGTVLPGQLLHGTPRMSARSYRDLVGDPGLWRDIYKHRDKRAGSAPYLSTGESLFHHDGRFVTYDDEISVSEKVSYAKAHSFGGVMVWELSGDYLPQRDPEHPLLQAIRRSRGF